jgi:hypothetical protein
MGQRIVLFCDGTWKNPDETDQGNLGVGSITSFPHTIAPSAKTCLMQTTTRCRHIRSLTIPLFSVVERTRRTDRPT